MKPARKHIASDLQAKDLIACRRRCCLCYFWDQDDSQKDGQIAHIDRDPSNASEDNLVFLCFRHHNQYDSVQSQGKNVQPEDVRHARNMLVAKYGLPASAVVLLQIVKQANPSEVLNRVKNVAGSESVLHFHVGPASSRNVLIRMLLQIPGPERLFGALDGGQFDDFDLLDASIGAFPGGTPDPLKVWTGGERVTKDSPARKHKTIARAGFLILHLSDLHFGNQSRFAEQDLHKLGKAFFRAVERARSQIGIQDKIQMVIVSGDLTEIGKPLEFKQANVFLDALSGEIGLVPTRFVLAPGNHDLSWPLCKKVAADQEIEGFDDAELRRRMDAVKLQFYDAMLAGLYGKPLDEMPSHRPLASGGWLHDFPELRLSVAALNTCELESHRPEDHRGHLSLQQSEALMETWRQHPYLDWLKIVVVHHNPIATTVANVQDWTQSLKAVPNMAAERIDHYAADVVGLEGRELLRRPAEQGASFSEPGGWIGRGGYREAGGQSGARRAGGSDERDWDGGSGGRPWSGLRRQKNLVLAQEACASVR